TARSSHRVQCAWPSLFLREVQFNYTRWLDPCATETREERYRAVASAASSPSLLGSRRPATHSTQSSITSRNSCRMEGPGLSRGKSAGSIFSAWRKKARHAGDTTGQGIGSRRAHGVQRVPPHRGEKNQAPPL